MSTPPSSSQQDIVSRFLDRPDSETYSELFHAIISEVTGYFRVRGCRPPADEDLAQDVLFTVYRKSHQLRYRNLFRPWLFSIARNALLQYRRKNRVENHSEIGNAGSPAADPLAGLQFRQWMAALSPDEQEALTLKYVEGLEYHEIAAVLGIPMGTVQWRVFQAKRKLAARFGRSS